MSDAGEQKLRQYLERATTALKQTKQKLEQLEAKASEPIAIVAMACRFPGGVRTPEDLWELLDEGRDAITPFPTDRGWKLDGLYDPDPNKPGTTYSRGGGFIENPAHFDAAFFGISPREAAAIDPQQRLLLELSWEALERARIIPESLYESNTGVFVGVCYDDYIGITPSAEVAEDGYATLGNLYSVASGRIAYTLGLKGPAITVDTACSTSLIAIHLACQSLRKGESDLALAGGATTFSTPDPLISFSRLKTLSPDGRCKAFSAQADGAGWAEGGGLVVLERLSDALRNGHPVLALVRGSAVNQDGRSQGLTAPNGPSQQRVIQAALANAGLSAAEVDAVEAHGTGTSLGDPIEAHAIMRTYGRGHSPDRPLWLGSIKSNIGHTQAAAGIAGVMKLVLGMQHERLPKTLHADEPSPHIDWSEGTVKLAQDNRPWIRAEQPRRAAVSSFGISGTNAHVILEEAPLATAEPSAQPSPTGILVPLLLAGTDAAALRRQAERLHAHVSNSANSPDFDLVDLAWSLLATRTQLAHRAAIVADSPDRALAELAELAAGRETATSSHGVAGPSSKLALLFTGQGSQRVGMGRELYEAHPRFRAAFDELCSEFDKLLDRPLRDVVFADPESADASLIDQTAYTQPALFALEVALFRTLERGGIRPDVVMGHSIGELAAAHVAGLWTLADACKLVAARGRLMQALPQGGAMVSITASEAEVGEALAAHGGRLDIAGLNGPLSTVISGDREAALAVGALFEAQGRKVRELTVSHAFHSPHMDPMLAEFGRVAASLRYESLKIPLISNVTGKLASEQELRSPEYWVRHVREAVRFLDGVRALEATGATVALELGPHGVLTSMAAGCLSDAGRETTALLASLRRDRSEREDLTRTVAAMHGHGVEIDWPRWFADHGCEAPRIVELPTYAFARELYWVATPKLSERGASPGIDATDHPVIGAFVALASDDTTLLTGRLSLADQPWLADHVVHGEVIVPGTLFVELACVAIERLGLAEIADLTFEAPLRLPERGAVDLQVRVADADERGLRALSIHSRPTGESTSWTHHVGGALGAEPDGSAATPLAWPPSGAEVIEIPGAYAELDARGLSYGPSFRGLVSAWARGDERFVEVRLPEELAGEGFELHPALLDATLHVLALVGDEPGRVALPFAWSGVRLHAAGAKALRVQLSRDADGYRIDARDLADARVMTAERLSLRATSAEELRGAIQRRRIDALQRIDWQALTLGSAPKATAWSAISARELPGFTNLASLEALQQRLEAGEPAPELLVASLEGGALEPLAATVHALELIRAWLSDGRLAGTSLVLVTHRAIASHADEAVLDLGHAPVWGLARTARSENAERRLQLVDIDGSDPSMGALAAAIASGEPELVLREGSARIPRLATATAGRAAEPALGEGTVLITGGTGALGSELARHLVEQRGVRALLLSSRRGPTAPNAAELQATLEAAGASVAIVASDLGDRGAVAELLRTRVDGRPITAIIHTAGIVDDGLLDSVTRERLAQVFAPKVVAGALLDELSRELQLAAFVLFTSISGLSGNAGQASYAAANSYLDALAANRRAHGLRGLSLAWGPWAGVGMAAELDSAAIARLRRLGFVPLKVAEGLALFDAALAIHDAATLVPARFDRNELRNNYDALAPLLRGLVRAPIRRASGTQVFVGLAAELAQMTVAERERVLVELIAGEAGSILGLGGGVAHDRPLQELGLDSLMAVELRNRLQKRASLRLPATLLFDYPTVKALAGLLLRELKVEPEPEPAAAQSAVRAHARTIDDDPIVIVSMACRYAGGVHTPEQLWDLLAAGRDAMSEFPRDRGWDLENLFNPDPDHPGTSVAREGGFLLDAAEFDAGFFGIAPREALSIDPQQRLLLETSWEAVERAGIPAETLRGTATGVFVGIMYSDYGSRLYGSPESLEGHVAIGSAPSVASGRIAYTLGFEGPALTVDTACSSSIVAVHLAAQALRNHECDLALAGGATVMATPTVFIEFSRQRGLASDGRCKAYSDAADGVGWAEGAGVLVLERMSDAKAKGHPILAIVRGSAINQDGRSQGLTSPNGPSQQRVIQAALADARLSPRDIDLVEGHGTGTSLGDPIEAGALQSTYGRQHSSERPLWLGSIKSNIGHTQAAAGVAGVIKMVLALQHQVLPRTLHASEPSTNIDWDGTVSLVSEVQPWAIGAAPRRGAVSSFGISGTNAHVVLEEAPTLEPRESAEAQAAPAAVPILLSGRSVAALRDQALRLREHLDAHADISTLDLGFSLATTRSRFEHRACVVASNREQLLPALDAIASGAAHPAQVDARAEIDGKLVFVFPGQGSQWAAMAKALLDQSAVFRESIDACARAIDPHTDWSLLAVLRGAPEAASLERVDVVQPVLFAMMVSLAALWRSLGVVPDAVVGHSQGEIVAACVAGALSLEDAAKVVTLRSKVIADQLGAGGMAAISLSAAELAPRLVPYGDRLSLAVDNGPASTAVSGDPKAIDEFTAALEADGVFARKIRVTYASHCAQIEGIRESLLNALAGLEPRRATIPMISTVDGVEIDGTELDANYWYRNLRQTVQFAGATDVLLDSGHRFFVEVSPHPVMPVALGGILDAKPITGAVIGTLRRDEGDIAQAMLSLGDLHCHGYDINWEAFFAPHDPRRVDLPTYAFQRQSYWLSPPRVSTTSFVSAGLSALTHPFLRATTTVATNNTRIVTGALSTSSVPWLPDHRVLGRAIVPGVGMAELVLSTLAVASPGAAALVIDEIILGAPLIPEDGETLQIQLVLSEQGPDGTRTFSLHSRPAEDEDAGWLEHASGGSHSESIAPEFVAEQWPPRDVEPVDLEALYEQLEGLGLHYGPAFRGLRRAWSTSKGEVFAELELPEQAADEGYVVHPALLDAALHTAFVATMVNGEPLQLLLPFAFRELSVHSIGATHLRIRASLALGSGSATLRLEAWDLAGQLVVRLGAVDVRPVSAAQLERSSKARHLYRLSWQAISPPRVAASPVSWGLVAPEDELARFASQLVERGVPVATWTSWDALVESIEAGAEAPSMLVRAWPRREWASPVTAAHEASEAALAELRDWLTRPALSGAELVFVTHCAVGVADEALDLAHAPLLGLARSARTEAPERRLWSVDLDGALELDELAQILALDGEFELARRTGEWMAPRLTPCPVDQALLAADISTGTVLVTGGTGELGAQLARHLVRSSGVRHLLLTSRHGLEASGASELVAELVELGCETVEVARCDVADIDSLAAQLAAIPGDRPLRGVFHLAGLLDDALLINLEPRQLHRVLQPKLDGAAYLHELTLADDLAAFVIFSSAAGVLGTPGQANYAAANSFVDALAHHRRAQKLPATSLAWGLWSEGGMIAHLRTADFARLRAQGIRPLSIAEGMAALDAALARPEALLVPIKLDVPALRQLDRVPSKFKALAPAGIRRAGPALALAGGLAGQLAQLSTADREAALLDRVSDEIRVVLRLPDALDPDRPLQELGLDSLMAVELRNRLQQLTGLKLSSTLAFDYPTARALVEMILPVLIDVPAPPTRTAVARVASEEPIAIVGMACHYPGGADSTDSLWQLLADGRDAISEFPRDRGWPLDLVNADPDAPGKSITGRGGFLHEAGEFDPSVFGMSPREALSTDPQQRLLLETSWEALEGAGIPPTSLRGSNTSVYVGIMYSDYAGRFALSPEQYDGYVGIGSAASVASGRVAYTLGLQGPAVSIDTACSSSLVAIHLACAALRSGETDLSLAGGVTVMATPTVFVEFSRQRGMATDGRCKSFSAQADGASWAEGVGVLVLERLDDAVRLGHPVLAVIRGSAINQDGRSQGLTAPNGPSQQRVIQAALAAARVDAADIDAVEAHGTGTRLGDPIEAQALFATYGRAHSADRPLWLGSIKSNIGHTQAAAGVAGIIKMVLAMQRGVLPKTLHAEDPSPHIDWSSGSIRLPNEPMPWQAHGRPRRAGVSSFGLSGTNAHVILEEAPASLLGDGATGVPAPAALPILLSATTKQGLQGQAARLRQHLDLEPALSMVDLGSSLATTRSHLEHRACVAVSSRSSLLAALDALAAGTPHPAYVGAATKAAGKLVFVFPGQGSQWLGMAKPLLEQSSVFRESLEACARSVDRYTNWSLLDVLRDESLASELERVDIIQPVLFSIMVSLAAVWRDLGVVPDAVIGHSQGEIAAAQVAGALSLDDAAKIVTLRSQIIAQQLQPGAMAAVSLSAAELQDQLAPYGDRLSLAVDNGPASTAVSGDPDTIDELVAALEAQGVFARKIRVTYASHCAHIEAIQAPLLEALAGLQPRKAAIPIFSTVDAAKLDGAELDAAYWYRNLRQTVRFAETTNLLLDRNHRLFVEVSPHPVMPVALNGLFDASTVAGFSVGTLRRDQGGLERVMLSLGELHCQGHAIDWRGFFEPFGARRVKLPTYAFQHRSFWLQAPTPTGAGVSGVASPYPLQAPPYHLSHPSDVSYWDIGVTREALSWRTAQAGQTNGQGPFSSAAQLDLLLSAARVLSAGTSLALTEVELGAALPVALGSRIELQLSATPSERQRQHLLLSSRIGPQWTPQVTAWLAPSMPADQLESLDVDAALAAHVNEHDIDALFDALQDAGLDHEDARPVLTDLRGAPDPTSVLARLELPEKVSAARFSVHPMLLDGCLSVAVALMRGQAPHGHVFAAKAIAELRLLTPLGAGPIWCRASTQPTSTSELDPCVMLDVWDKSGAPLARLSGLKMAPQRQPAAPDRLGEVLLGVGWHELAVAPSNSPRPGRWLLLGGADFGPRLATALERSSGEVCSVVDIDPRSFTAVASEIDRALAGGPLTGVICLWSLDAVPLAVTEAIPELGDWSWTGPLHVVQDLAKRTLRDTPRVVIVTCRGQATGARDHVDPQQALAWGLGGAIRAEHPNMRPLRIDLGDSDDARELERLVDLVCSESAEDQLSVRQSRIFTARLERIKTPASTPHVTQAAHGPYRVEFDGSGIATLASFDIPSPAPGEVEIAVDAASFSVWTRSPEPLRASRPPAGSACVGRISRAGAGVDAFERGQRVIAIAPGSLASHVLASATLVHPVNEDIDDATAAGLPLALGVAGLGLARLARLREGERVVIHPATTFVGVAALRWALALGARVFATATNGGAVEGLREQGVEACEFVDQRLVVERIRAWSGGKGADALVIDGESRLVAPLDALSSHGCVIELSLSGGGDDCRVGSSRRTGSHHRVDALEAALAEPELFNEMLAESLKRVGLSRVPDLLRVPLAEVEQLRDAVSNGPGRVVATVTQTAKPRVRVVRPSEQPLIRSGRAYLITGGLGGLGLGLAQWMAEQGAEHLVLVGRRGLTRDDQRAAIQAMERAGAKVTVASIDIAQRAAVAELLASIPDSTPLAGIVHAAAVLDDKMLVDLTRSSFERVLAPKIAGAWNLHCLSLDLDLDFFVLYSSAAALLGSPGQANYTAANAFLDALAQERRGLGLEAVSLAWGVFSEVGLAAADANRGARLSSRGFGVLSPKDGVELFARLARSARAHVAPCPFDPRAWIEFYPTSVSPFLSGVIADEPQRTAEADARIADLESLPFEELEEHLVELVLTALGEVIRADPADLGPDTPFSALGVDSLMGLELRNRLGSLTGQELPSTAIWTYPTASELARYLAESFAQPTPDVGGTDAEAAAKAVAVVEAEAVDSMSDDEAEAALREELASLESLLDD